MANIYALKTGNWSDTTVWNTGALPTATDDVYANGFTVTINQNVTVLSLNTASNTGILAGGFFSVSGSFTISANIIAGTTTCMTITSTGVVNLIGNVFGGPAAAVYGVNFTAAGIVNLTGNATGGSSASATGFNNTGNGTLNMTGTATGGASTNSMGVGNGLNSTANIIGNAIGGTAGGVGNNSSGAHNFGTGTLNITGSAIASFFNDGVRNAGAGIVRVDRAVGSSATLTANPVGVYGMAITGTTIVKAIEFGPSGQVPVGGYVKFDNAVTHVSQVRTEANTNVTLTDALNSANLLPAIANVRAGTSYNAGNLTGTLAVPAPANVRVGIATDNTVGTASLSPADIVSAVQTAFPRMVNVATVQSTGDQLAALQP